VPAGVRVAAPIHFYAWLGESGSAQLPRLLVVAEEGSAVSLVEEYGSPDHGDLALSGPVTEIWVGPGATVDHVTLQGHGQGVFHLATQRARVDRDATFRSFVVSVGAKVSRLEVQAVFAGAGARGELLGLLAGDRRQHLDHHTLQW